MTMPGKVGIFNPYWDTIGGGEKYTAGVAKVFADKGDAVELFWPEEKVIGQIEARFGIKLNKVTVNREAYRLMVTGGNWWQKYWFETDYDWLFFVSDGSVPLMFGQNNLLHMQVPFKRVNGHSLINRIKLGQIKKVVVNSGFTKAVIDKEYGVVSQIIYPPVKTIPAMAKEKLILSVGRFDNTLHSKRQDVLIEAFKQLKPEGWKLVLAGGVLKQTEVITKLKAQAEGYPIEIISNPSHEELVEWYGRASIYWHAAGFDQDFNTHPERAEHFGIATVEAMSAGAVPVVFAGGGQTEIVTEGENGYLWHTIEELVEKTVELIKSGISPALAGQAQLRAIVFSEEAFERQFKQIIG